MADPHVITTLRRKRDDIERAITAYEAKLAQARRDLAHVNATLHLFEVGDQTRQFPIYADLRRLFRNGEMVKLCKAALEARGAPMTTRELALAVVQAKGWDASDKELRKAVAFRLVQALGKQAKRGVIGDAGKQGGVRIWQSRP